MSRKNVVKSYNIFDEVSIAATQISASTNVINLDNASVHVKWTGSSPVGVLTVQARNGENDAWYDLDMGGTISISGNSGDHQLVFNSLPFTDLRLIYTRTSGSGNLTAALTMKTVGA